MSMPLHPCAKEAQSGWLSTFSIFDRGGQVALANQINPLLIGKIVFGDDDYAEIGATADAAGPYVG
jgi:hypothetical protein